MKKIGMMLMAAAVAVSLAAGTSYAVPGKGHAYGHAKKQWVPVQEEHCRVVVPQYQHRHEVARPEVKVVVRTEVPPCREERHYEGDRHHEHERAMHRTHLPDRPGLVIVANIPVLFQ